MQADVSTLDLLGAAARKFLSGHPDGAVVGLMGELGAGKTTFVRSCVRTLSKTTLRVTSPSFTLHQSYKHLTPPIEHFDLYRLDRADEAALLELGYFETVENALGKKGFIFIEWPERAFPSTKVLLLTHLLKIDLTADGKRHLSITNTL